MNWIITPNLQELQDLDKKINEWMQTNIKDYSATRWADIYKHPTLNLYAYPVKDSDPRKPFAILSILEKSKCLMSLDDTWYTRIEGVKSLTKITDQILNKSDMEKSI